jgi:hypothetical protein
MAQQRSRWRAATRVLGMVLTVSVPALALALLGSTALGSLAGPAVAVGDFRVLETSAQAPTQAVKTQATAEGDATEVQLTTWEGTKVKVSRFK